MAGAKGDAPTQVHHVVPQRAAMVTGDLPTCGSHPDRDCCIGLCGIGGQEDDGAMCGRMEPR